MATYPDWEHIQHHPELAQIISDKITKTNSDLFKYIKEEDVSKYRIVYKNIYECIEQCRGKNEKSYQYPLEQKDLVFL